MKGICLFIAVILINSCATAPVTTPKEGVSGFQGSIQGGAWMRNLLVPYMADGAAHDGTIQIYFPKGYQKGESARTLIVLHGYSQNMRSWENNTNIEHYADLYHFVLVCPDMGKTLYETEFYPETSVKWAKIPGGKYVAEVMIKHIRSTFGIAADRSRTGIFGLSTGGRGALLLSALHADIFGAAAGLSGDYDPTSMTEDKLLASVYGEYKSFPARWENDANVIKWAENLKNTPVFLSHGGKDFVVPKEQSVILAVRLKQLQNQHGGYEIVYRDRKYKQHDWSFWGSMLPDVMKFFDEKLAK